MIAVFAGAAVWFAIRGGDITLPRDVRNFAAPVVFSQRNMKTKTPLIVAAIAAALQLAPLGYAQDKDGDRGFRRHGGRHGRIFANLSPDERTKLRAARQQAMADPAVRAAQDRQRQAHREFQELRRQKMIQADPSVQPILDKIKAERGGKI